MIFTQLFGGYPMLLGKFVNYDFTKVDTAYAMKAIDVLYWVEFLIQKDKVEEERMKAAQRQMKNK